MKNLSPQDCGKRNYDIYVFKKGENILYITVCGFTVLFLAFFFYRNIWAAVLLSPIGLFLYKQIKEQKKESRKAKLSSQFKECILCVAANLRAGYSAENAFCQSHADMVTLFGDNCLMAEELMWMKSGLQNHINLEELLEDFADRSTLKDIREFAEVFVIVKRNGGSLPAVISDTAVLLSDRMEMQKEIRVLISGRQLEQKIMSVIPFGIVLYVEFTTPGYFDILYQNISGTVIMSICLVVYIAAYIMGQRIMDIKLKAG